jgi:hypothetical protein
MNFSYYVSFNDAMEEALDKKIEQNRWYMSLPVVANIIIKIGKLKKKNFRNT